MSMNYISFLCIHMNNEEKKTHMDELFEDLFFSVIFQYQLFFSKKVLTYQKYIYH